MRNHLGHEERAAKAGKRIASGTAPEVAKQPIVEAAAGPGQDTSTAGILPPMPMVGNVGQPVKKGFR